MNSSDDTQPANGTATNTQRNARLEAQRLLSSAGGQATARVLEPSPPTNQEDPFFADDPVAVTEADSDTVVLPVGVAAPANAGETIDWNQWLIDHPEHNTWAAERWLGGARQLPPIPESLAASRTALHRLAAYVVAPVRHQANGKFGLRWTKGGFGTPFFGSDRQVRVDGVEIVDQHGDQERRTPITSLQGAADFLGSAVHPDTAAEQDSPALGDATERLPVDEAGADFVNAWFGMGFAALEVLRSDEASINPSRPQLWPGHFDPAIETGTDDTRGSYGASPGDHNQNEPYLYVSVWWPDRVGLDKDDDSFDHEFWNAQEFVGRKLMLSDFPNDTDPVDVAAQFWRETRDQLTDQT